MSNILENIIEFKKREVIELKRNFTINDFISTSNKIEKPRGFINKLLFAEKNGFGLIAEIKKSSPSKGIIRKNFFPEKIALDYKESGASCLSVLTDSKFFGGNNEYLKKVKSIVDLPILRKDFLVDEIQIYESRFIGADCILLIVACLNDEELEKFYNLGKSLEMDVLLEVHNEEELERALILKPQMIGINNRNLKTMTVSLETSVSLLKIIPDNVIVISESGLKTHHDLKFMQSLGIKSFLIGETFMKSENIKRSVNKILHGD